MIKKIIFISTLFGLMGFVAFVGMKAFASPVQAGHDQVKLCHKLGNGTFNYLVVDDDAVPGHLGHGDFLYGGGSWFRDFWCNTHIPPTPTPLPTATPTVTPSVTPTNIPEIPDSCDGECDQVTPTPSPTIEPEPEVPHPQPQLTGEGPKAPS